MTPANQPQAPRATRDSRKPRAATDPLQDAGDALLRSALEACRQHERLAQLLHLSTGDDELRDTAAVCELSDKHLAARTKEYEKVATAGKGKGKTPDDFWRAANTLWHSSCEYARRHRSCDALTTKMTRHSSEQLGELTLEYELEASSLLALRQAIAAYRTAQPNAE